MKSGAMDLIENMLNAVFEQLERNRCIPKATDKNELIHTIKTALESLSDKEQLIKDPPALMKTCQTAILCAVSLHNNPVLRHDKKEMNLLLNKIFDLIFKNQQPSEKEKIEIKAKIRLLLNAINKREANVDKPLNDKQIVQLAEKIADKLFPKNKKEQPLDNMMEQKQEEDRLNDILVSIFGVDTKRAGAVVPVVQQAALNLLGYVDTSPNVSQAEIGNDRNLAHSSTIEHWMSVGSVTIEAELMEYKAMEGSPDYQSPTPFGNIHKGPTPLK